MALGGACLCMQWHSLVTQGSWCVVEKTKSPSFRGKLLNGYRYRGFMCSAPCQRHNITKTQKGTTWVLCTLGALWYISSVQHGNFYRVSGVRPCLTREHFWWISSLASLGPDPQAWCLLRELSSLTRSRSGWGGNITALSQSWKRSLNWSHTNPGWRQCTWLCTVGSF